MTKKESTILKGFAIILMLIHHLFCDVSVLNEMGVKTLFISLDDLLFLGSSGKLCVAIFIFISAYGMTASLEKNEDLVRYTYHRYVSLMLPFVFIYILALISAIITGTLVDIYGNIWQSFLYYGFVDMLGLANLFGTPTLNGTWWYMSLAFWMIILVPFLNLVYKKMGVVGTLLCGIFIPAAFGVAEIDIFRWYMLTISLGIVIKKKNFEFKLSNNKYINGLILMLICIAIYVLMFMRYGIGAYWITEPIAIILFVYLVKAVTKTKILSFILEKLGKHSYNMFLTHSFIFYYYFRDFTYKWKYAFIILVVLLCADFALSVLIEFLKRICGFDKFEQRISQFRG